MSPSLVRLGDLNLATTDDGAQPTDFKIKRFIRHNNYNPMTKQNDIALIELEDKVKFSSFIRPACLNQHEHSDGTVVAVIQKHFDCFLICFIWLLLQLFQTGWGKLTAFSSTSDNLMKVSLPIVDSQTCYEMLQDDINADEIFESQICAGGIKNQVRKVN